MKCPHCFWPLPAVIEKLSCVGPCQSETLAEMTHANGGIDMEVKPVFPVEQERCSRCSTPSNVEACPVCHGAIPREWRYEPTPRITCVAMAGARTSGKSLYLAVLKSQLEIFVENRHDSILDSLGNTEQHFHERYANALFENQQILPATLEAARDAGVNSPLMFQFRDIRGRLNILVLRDVAGEDLENLLTRRAQLSFLTRADAIITLVDPLKIDQIARVLQGKVHVGELGGDGVTILKNLLDFLRESEGRQKTSKRIAVAISKFDTLQQLKDAESDLSLLMSRPGSPLMRDPSMKSPSLDANDAELLHLEVESLFKKLEGKSLDNLLRERCSNFRYFAVSSLGADPEGESINAIGIAPFRVLDPVKWVMGL